jgi:hypothetical protein
LVAAACARLTGQASDTGIYVGNNVNNTGTLFYLDGIIDIHEARDSGAYTRAFARVVG